MRKELDKYEWQKYRIHVLENFGYHPLFAWKKMWEKKIGQKMGDYMTRLSAFTCIYNWEKPKYLASVNCRLSTCDFT